MQVINISSPNTPGLRQLQGRKQLKDLVKKVCDFSISIICFIHYLYSRLQYEEEVSFPCLGPSCSWWNAMGRGRATSTACQNCTWFVQTRPRRYCSSMGTVQFSAILFFCVPYSNYLSPFRLLLLSAWMDWYVFPNKKLYPIRQVIFYFAFVLEEKVTE